MRTISSPPPPLHLCVNQHFRESLCHELVAFSILRNGHFEGCDDISLIDFFQSVLNNNNRLVYLVKEIDDIDYFEECVA